MMLPSIQVREEPGQIVVELDDGKPLRLEVSLPYTFDCYSIDDDFLVIAMNYAFDCILGMP